MVHSNLVVPGLEVELREELGALKFIQELLHNRNRELVLDGAFIKGAIVHIEAPRSVQLLDK
jgi:hypothetical protein